MRSIVIDRVAWSVCQSVTVVTSAKMTETIKMPFGLRTRADPKNQVLDGGPDAPWKDNFSGKGRLIVKYTDTLR